MRSTKLSVIAGLVPASPNIWHGGAWLRGGWDKRGHDRLVIGHAGDM
jgi:hypothetical protein